MDKIFLLVKTDVINSLSIDICMHGISLKKCFNNMNLISTDKFGTVPNQNDKEFKTS